MDTPQSENESYLSQLISSNNTKGLVEYIGDHSLSSFFNTRLDEKRLTSIYKKCNKNSFS